MRRARCRASVDPILVLRHCLNVEERHLIPKSPGCLHEVGGPPKTEAHFSLGGRLLAPYLGRMVWATSAT